MRKACAGWLPSMHVAPRAFAAICLGTVVLLIALVTTDVAYADRVPADMDYGYAPAPDQVIDTTQDPKDPPAGVAAEASGTTSAGDRDDSAAAEPTTEESNATSTMVSEAAKAEQLRFGAWFIENDKAALAQAQESVRPDGVKQPTEPSSLSDNGNPLMTKEMHSTLIALVAAAFSGILAAIMLAKARTEPQGARENRVQTGRTGTSAMGKQYGEVEND